MTTAISLEPGRAAATGHEPAADEPVPSADARPGRRVPSDLWLALATAIVALVAVVPVLQLWRADLHIPFADRGDANFYAMVTKGIVENGWYERNEALGAPFGQALSDFPQGGDNLQVLIVKILGAIANDFAVATNLYYLLTFPLVAVAAVLVLRRLGASPAAALVCAVRYACLPYHFRRGEEHLFLSGYWGVPIGAFLAVSVLRGEALVSRRAGSFRSSLVAHASRRTLATLALCAVVGSTGFYYASFTLLLVFVAGVVAYLRDRSRTAAVSALVVLSCVAGSLLLNLTPNIVYQLRHGSNPEVAARHPADSEYFGLKLNELVLPRDDHRVAALAGVNAAERSLTQLPSEGGQSLGTVGTLAFVWLLGVALVGLTGGERRLAAGTLHRHLAALTVVAVLLATVSGFGSLIAYLISPKLRSLNRMSVFIAFFALAAAALLVDAARRRIRGKRGRLAITTGLAGLLVLGLLDQTSASVVPDYDATARQFESDGAFVRGIEERLPAGAMVFQLPYVAFPESGPLERMADYDLLRGYLHSKDLRWSYGGLRGREADWQARLVGQPIALVVDRLAAAGFAGVTVDRFGYSDNGRQIEAELAASLGAPGVVSPDGRLSFFSLSSYVEDLGQRYSAEQIASLREGTLDPVGLEWGPGFSDEAQAAGRRWRVVQPSAEVRVVNEGDAARVVTVSGELVATGTGPVRVLLEYPDGTVDEFDVPLAGQVFERQIRIRPGPAVIRFSTLAPPSEKYELVNPAVFDTPPQVREVEAGRSAR